MTQHPDIDFGVLVLDQGAVIGRSMFSGHGHAHCERQDGPRTVHRTDREDRLARRQSRPRLAGSPAVNGPLDDSHSTVTSHRRSRRGLSVAAYVFSRARSDARSCAVRKPMRNDAFAVTHRHITYMRSVHEVDRRLRLLMIPLSPAWHVTQSNEALFPWGNRRNSPDRISTSPCEDAHNCRRSRPLASRQRGSRCN